MKKKLIFLFMILFLIGVYFGYKGYYLYKYNIDQIQTAEYKNVLEGFKIENTIFIKKEKLEESAYLTFQNMKIRNDFKDFKINEASTEDFIKYVLYDGKEVVASFWMGETDTYLPLFKNKNFVFGASDRKTSLIDLSSFLEKNHIDTDISLFQFIEKNKDKKNHIFMSVKEMKENYTLPYLTSIIMPSMQSITLLEGEYSGYILNLEDVKEVSILKGARRYVFTFIKRDYFTDDYIKELLNTVDIKG